MATRKRKGPASAGPGPKRKYPLPKKGPPCPSCESAETVAIEYGYPLGKGDDLMRRAAEGRAYAGGDVIFENSPKWFCTGCKHKFGRLEERKPKLSQREIKQLARAIVDSMVVETKVTKRGGLVLEMELPKPPKKRSKRKARKNG